MPANNRDAIEWPLRMHRPAWKLGPHALPREVYMGQMYGPGPEYVVYSYLENSSDIINKIRQRDDNFNGRKVIGCRVNSAPPTSLETPSSSIEEPPCDIIRRPRASIRHNPGYNSGHNYAHEETLERGYTEFNKEICLTAHNGDVYSSVSSRRTKTTGLNSSPRLPLQFGAPVLNEADLSIYIPQQQGITNSPPRDTNHISPMYTRGPHHASIHQQTDLQIKCHQITVPNPYMNTTPSNHLSAHEMSLQHKQYISTNPEHSRQHRREYVNTERKEYQHEQPYHHTLLNVQPCLRLSKVHGNYDTSMDFGDADLL